MADASGKAVGFVQYVLYVQRAYDVYFDENNSNEGMHF